MNISLVTGGAGFIGSHLVRALLAKGHFVRVLDNFSTGRRENLSSLDGSLEVIEGDIRDPVVVEESARGVDLVFHLAADVSVPQSMQEPQICFDINVQGTLHILDASRKMGVRQVVLASSCAVYGDSENFPLSETEPPRPLSPYAASKQVDEVYARMYTRIYDLPVIALRYFNVYGPRQSPDSVYAAVIPVFTSAMLNGRSPTVYGDGKQSRDFVNVRDVVRANLLAAEKPQVAGRVFNVCTGRETNLLELIQTLRDILPDAPEHVHTSPRPGDIYRSLGNPKEAAQGLDFKAEVSLKDGLVQIVKWTQK